MKSVFPVTAPNSMAPTQLCMGPDWITRLWSSMTSSITPALVPSVIISTAAQRRNNSADRPTDRLYGDIDIHMHNMRCSSNPGCWVLTYCCSGDAR